MDYLLKRLILVCLCALTLLQSSTAQNETLTATANAKYLSSPGYPTQYPNNLTYEWLISSSSDSELVKIEVDDCVIEYVPAKVPFCQIDKLTIYDGAYDNATVLYESCCITSVPAMNSSGPHMLIKFTTDTTIVARGFQIKYYNTAYVPEEVAAAFAIYIAITAVIIALGLTVAAVAFYIYKLKKTKEQRINPVGGEEATTSSRNNKYNNQMNDYIDEYKKRPLHVDSPVPPPKDWSELDGMRAPETTGPLAKPDIINDSRLPDGRFRGNQLSPIHQVTPVI